MGDSISEEQVEAEAKVEKKPPESSGGKVAKSTLDLNLDLNLV